MHVREIRNILLGTALLGACLLPLGAESAPAVLTVEQAVDAALRNNLSVKSADVLARSKKRASEFSFNKFYPTISTSATTAYSDVPSKGLMPVNQGANGLYSDVSQYTSDKTTDLLGLNIQEVFSAVYIGQMVQASIDYQSSLITKAKATKQMTAAVKKFYYQLIVQKEAIELTRARLDNANERLRQAQVSFEVGNGTELNYIYAKTSVESLIPDLRAMETSRIIALTQFQEMLGFDKRDDMELSGSLEDDSNQLTEVPKIDGARFDVSESVISVKLLETAVKLHALTLLPNLILQYADQSALNGPKSSTIFHKEEWNQTTQSLSLTLSWDISGFIPFSDYQVTHANLKDQLALQRESTENTIKNAQHDEENQRRLIKDSLDKIENLKSVVADTKRSYDLTDASYKAGVGRYLDLQSAELAWQGTQISLLNERLNLLSLVYDMEAKYNNGN